MKLRDFSEKPLIGIKKASQFIIQNDAAEIKYMAQIDDLNKELGYYRNLEAERDTAVAENVRSQEKNRECQKNADSLAEELQTIKETVIFQEDRLEKLPEMDEKLKGVLGQLGSKNNELEVMTATAFDQSSQLSLLRKQVEGLQNENVQLTQATSQAEADKISAEEEAKTVLVKNIELQTFTMKTSTINKKLETDYSQIRDERNFWEKEAQESQSQFNDAVQVEVKLRGWLNKLEKTSSENFVHKEALDKEIISLQTTVTDMDKAMEEVMEELKYLRDINKEYRKELAKPRYLSMSTIAKREGFKMPIGKENIRTHNLGNVAPTLLKFKAEEKSNG